MQVGVAVLSNHLVSLSLGGFFNFWKLDSITGESVDTPDFSLTGHVKSVLSVDYSNETLISVDIEGKICKPIFKPSEICFA